MLVALESEAPADKLEALGKQLAMHIAAAFPLALNEEDLDPAVIERERAIAQGKAAESGKPAEIVAKMVDGAIAKYRKENALVSQLFVMDGKTKISDVVAAAAEEAGSPIALKDYVRFEVGSLFDPWSPYPPSEPLPVRPDHPLLPASSAVAEIHRGKIKDSWALSAWNELLTATFGPLLRVRKLGVILPDR